LIIIPFVASRFLLLKQIIEPVKRVRGIIIDIGFAVIIYTSVGVNSHVFISDFSTLFKVSLSILLVMFGGSFLLKKIIKKQTAKPDIISSQLLFAVKSSGFSVVTAIQLFGDKAAVPPTILSVAVLIYLLFTIYKNK
jgi:BASS family bile acid:Na+ symporter